MQNEDHDKKVAIKNYQLIPSKRSEKTVSKLMITVRL